MEGQHGEQFEGFAIVELLGHRKLGGYVREVTIAGAGFLRIDVPGESVNGLSLIKATQYIPPSSLYCLTPTTEEMARAVATRYQPEPVQRWELPAPREESYRYPEADRDDDTDPAEIEDRREPPGGW